ncbi:unknown [Clostridium sp. CAG:921]|nr:unknown [Clostridium sp. CAG:921]
MDATMDVASMEDAVVDAITDYLAEETAVA